MQLLTILENYILIEMEMKMCKKRNSYMVSFCAIPILPKEKGHLHIAKSHTNLTTLQLFSYHVNFAPK